MRKNFFVNTALCLAVVMNAGMEPRGGVFGIKVVGGDLMADQNILYNAMTQVSKLVEEPPAEIVPSGDTKITYPVSRFHIPIEEESKPTIQNFQEAVR